MALKEDGTVWAWGSNSVGQLGDGTGVFGAISTVPVQVVGLNGITAIAAGDYHSMALKNDGTLWVWGLNQYGLLGIGSTTDSNVPVQVSSLTGVAAIAAGWEHSLALKNDGTLWAWGYNYRGQLGDGTTTNRDLPVQVTGLCDIATGVVEETDHTTLEIFPNPTAGKFTMQHSIRDASFVICTAVGQEIMQGTITGTYAEIDLSSRPDGVYVMTLSSAERVMTKKLIKQ